MRSFVSRCGGCLIIVIPKDLRNRYGCSAGTRCWSNSRSGLGRLLMWLVRRRGALSRIEIIGGLQYLKGKWLSVCVEPLDTFVEGVGCLRCRTRCGLSPMQKSSRLPYYAGHITARLVIDSYFSPNICAGPVACPKLLSGRRGGSTNIGISPGVSLFRSRDLCPCFGGERC